MKFLRVKIKLFIITMLMLNSVYAIDISVTNGTISPETIPAFGMYTLSFDINNQGMPPATTPEDAVFLIISITGFDQTNVGSISNHTQGGWTCVINTGSIDCDKPFAPTEFSAGNTQPFFIDINTNSIVVNPDTFNVTSSDESGLVEDNFADNNITINSVAGTTDPDLDFDEAATLINYNGVEGQVAPILMDFRVLNIGDDAIAGGSMTIAHDEFLFSLIEPESTIPAGWTCFTQTGGTECSTGSPILAASSTNFQLAFNSGPQGNYAFNGNLIDFSGNDSNLGNNTISTNLVLAAAVPDLQMDIVTPNTFPVHVEEGSTVPTPFTFRVEDIGNTIFQQSDVEVFIGHNPLFTIANVQTMAVGWSCSPDTGGFRCSNDTVLVLPTNQIDISGEITAYPSAIMEYMDAVTAVVNDLSGVEGAAGNTGNNTFDLSVGITPLALDTDLELLKFAKDGPGVANVIPGDWPLGTNFYYQIHVNNLSTTAGTLVEVVDALPAGVQFVNDLSDPSWACSEDPFVNEFTPQIVTCNHPSIPASSPNFNEIIVLEVAPLNLGMKSNTAVVGSIENDVNPLNNDNIATPSVVNIINPVMDPDVDITKTFLSGVIFDKSGTLAEENSIVTYQILVNNNSSGSPNATNVVINDVLPAGVTFDSIAEVGPNYLGNCSFNAGTGPNGAVTCTAASIPFTVDNDGVNISVLVDGTIGSFIDNTATVTADNDSTPGNNTASSGVFEVITSSGAQLDLAMFKDAQTLAGVSESNFDVNEHFNYVLTISNSGSDDDAAVADVLVTDIMPADIDIVNVTSAIGWDCNNSDFANGIIECINTTPIEISTSHEIVIEVVSQVAANYDNLATVDINKSSTAVDVDGSNNFDNVIINVASTSNGDVDLNILKDAQTVGGSTSVNNFLVGESFEYKLVVHNIGPNDAPVGEVEITDALPMDIDLDATPNSVGWDCSGTSGNIVKCVNTMPITAVSGFLTLIVPVSSQVEGSYLNSAGVALTSTASVNELDLSNNNATFNVTINPASGNLSLVKSVIGGTATRGVKNRFLGNPNFAIGDVVTYTLLAQNTSTINAVTDMVIIDALDTNFLSFDGFNIIQSSANFSCGIDGTGLVTCSNSSGGPLNPGESFEVEILTTAIAAGNDISNTANISSASTGDNFNSNTVFIDIDSGLLPTTLSVVKEALVNGDPVTSVTKGSGFTYRVSIQNTGNEDAQNLSLVDNMPTGITINSAAGTGWSCTNTGLQYTCDLSGPLLVGTSSFVEFDVVDDSSATVSQLQNVVDVTADNAPMVSDVNNIDSIANTGGLNYTISIDDNIDPVTIGASFMYDVTVTNTGSLPITSLDFDVTIPLELMLTSFTPNNANCTASNTGLSCQSTASLNLLTGDTINVLNMVVNAPDFIGNVTTHVSAIAQGSLSATASEVTTIVPETSSDADVSLVKTASASSVPINSNFNYLLTVSNNSSITANNVAVTDILPGGVVFNSVEGTGWSCTGTSSIVCNTATMDANSSSIITIDVNAPAVVGSVSNTAQVSINGQDPDSSNNTSQVSVNVTDSGQTAHADLSIHKTASTKSVTSGDQFNWIIDVTNHGPDSAQNVSITDQLPSGFEVISATINGDNTCKANGKELLCNIGTVVNEETKTLTILGTASLATGVLDNLASVASDTIDPDTKNNSDTASIMVDPVTPNSADIYVEVLTESNAIQGGIAQFNVQPGNNGPDSSVRPSISMVASGNISSVVLDSGSDWNCQVIDLVLINCDFNGTEMINGHQSTLHVKLDPEAAMGGGGQILGLTATISSETSDPDASNNTDSAEINDAGGTPTEEEMLAAMQAALAGIANQQTLKAIENVASYCGNSYESALEGLCESLYNAALDGEGILLNEVMEQITPNQVIGQSSSVSEIAKAQFRNVGARLSQLRGGGGSGFSSAGLNARYGNGSIPLGMLAYLNESSDESGGSNKPDPSFISPWGFFVNGSISMGERDATGRELGFDFDTFGLTAGVDYRLDANKVLGVAIGYANFDSKIEDSAELNSTGLTLTGYGSFYVNDNFYVDSRISIAKPDFDQSRNIDFDIDDISVHRTAVGKTNANQYSYAMSAGYHFNKKAWNITPNASVNYTKTNIDGFSETGAGEYNFIYSKQEIESLVWSAGMKVSKAISLKNGVITPQFDLDYNYESLNDGINIEARFITAPEDEIFIIETDSPDRTYGSAGLGLVYISSNGKQAYINYRSLFGLEGFSRGTFNLGARFEF